MNANKPTIHVVDLEALKGVSDATFTLFHRVHELHGFLNKQAVDSLAEVAELLVTAFGDTSTSNARDRAAKDAQLLQTGGHCLVAALKADDNHWIFADENGASLVSNDSPGMKAEDSLWSSEGREVLSFSL